jgi:hypothetical protein
MRPWLAFMLLFTGCMLAACETILPLAGRLLATAAGNYDAKYGQLVEDLTSALRAQHGKGAVETTELTLEVALLRQEDRAGEVVPVPMADGERLSWRGSLEASDRFKIFFRPSADCFVYVVLIDSTGFVQVLHPETGTGLLARAGQGTFLPPGNLDLAYAVDQHRGIETIYFTASRAPRTDLEQALRPFLGRKRPQLDRALGVAQLADDYLQLGIASRGTGGPAAVPVRTGTARFVTEAFVKAAGKDLVVTRWFDHR